MAIVAEQTNTHKNLKKPKTTPLKLVPLGAGIAFFAIIGFVYIPFETFIIVFILVYLPFILAFFAALRKAMEKETPA